MNISPALRERFIITADDYGIRQTVAPIFQLAQKGKLDRVAVMVRFTTREDAARLLTTNVKIDIHLELIRLLRRGHREDDGLLWRTFNFLLRYVYGYLSSKRVEAEWRSQIENFHTLFGRYPEGLNSHEHVHYFPPFFRVAAKLAQEYQIPFLRFGRREMLLHLHEALIGKILVRLARRDKKYLDASGVGTSDYLVSFDWLTDFERFLREIPTEGTIELVFHPERGAEAHFLEESF